MLHDQIDRFNYKFKKIYPGCSESHFSICYVKTGITDSTTASWTIDGLFGKNWQATNNSSVQNVIHQFKDFNQWNVQADWNMCFNLMCQYAGYV